MKKLLPRFALLTVLSMLVFFACQKEKAIIPDGPLSAQYTDLKITDPFSIPNPAATEKYALQLFDKKEDGDGLTHAELLSVGDPAQDEGLLYALLFVEKYERHEILWSWDEPELEADLDDRSHYGKWKWTGDDPIASMWCSGFQKWPAHQVANRFTDPCGATRAGGPVYVCCHHLCDGNLPVACQADCDVPVVTLPAGSEDALAQAVAEVCPNGTILLEAGEHIENEGVVIDKPVRIIGEDGAILRLVTTPYDLTAPMDVGLHFLGAYGSRLENIHLEATTNVSGTAVLFEDSDRGRVMDCTFTDFQISILVEQSDKMHIEGNTLANSLAWTTGDILFAFGIMVINGEKTQVIGNEVSQCNFGIWACDERGLCEGNSTHDNVIGIILCKVPEAYLMPFGAAPIGSLTSATEWRVMDNISQNNQWGYLSIDGANHNKLINNQGGNNALYDMELAGDTERFGFFAPASSCESVTVGPHNLTIKDCGENNVINGVYVEVDTGSDPCF